MQRILQKCFFACLLYTSSVEREEVYEQLDLFTDYEAQRKKKEEEEAALDREKRMQEAMLSIKKKFGKNAVLKGMNLQEGATARDRNEQWLGRAGTSLPL